MSSFDALKRAIGNIMRCAAVPDHSTVAERLFRDVAAALNLQIETHEDDPVDVSMMLPKQAGLSHDVWLCLLNGDELWFSVDNLFTCSMFPFPDIKDRFVSYLRCTLIGEYRIVLMRRRETSPLICSELQRPCLGGWETICHYSRDLGFHRLFGLRL